VTPTPRNYSIHGLIGPAESRKACRKCLLCGHRNHCHAMIKVGVRHYVHARCAIDNDPAIIGRMPHWILSQLPISAFDGQDKAFLTRVLRLVRDTP